MSIRTCKGCEYLNKRKKTKPCEKEFTVVYDSINKIFIRPNKCKKKFEKVNPKKQFKKLKQ